MKAENDLIDQASLISPLAAKRYAEAKGWEFLKQGVNSRLYLFRHPKDHLRQLIIPMDGGDRDYGLAMLDVARRLSDLEQRPLESILSSLILPGADVLRFRIISSQAESGFLSLLGGISLLEGAKRAIMATACSVEHPQKHHRRMREEAIELVSSCQLGQTERGSYIVKIACPVDALHAASIEERDSFVRRTTILLMTSSKYLVEAIEHDEVQKIYEVKDEESLLSSNFCDALLRMQAADDKAHLSLSVSWASILHPPMAETPNQVTFSPEYIPIIEQVREKLRPADELKESIFVGTVEKLSGVRDSEGRRSGEVTLSVIHQDEMILAKANLNADEYEIADRAHMSGWMVSLKGVLHLGLRVSKITDLSNFKLLKN